MTDTRMKFKTRLWITFVTMIVLPIVLTAIAFGIISYTVIHKEGLNYGIEINNYTMWSDSISSFGKLTDEVFYKLEIQADMDPSRFLNKKFLANPSDTSIISPFFPLPLTSAFKITFMSYLLCTVFIVA